MRGVFADLLRGHRLAAGLTQQDLAERAGVSARSISDLEREIALRPRRDTAAMLAAGLRLSGAERDTFLSAARNLPRGVPAGARSAYPPLPLPAEPLLGRAAELQATADALTRGDVRLLTLVGPGGVGKTRLAIETAHHLADAFADGVLFVRLDGLADPALVLPTLAAALQLLEGDGEQLLDQLSAHLASRDLLIVLDNLEHLLAAAPRITDLLADVPNAKVLATSRESLRIAGEHLFRLAPLPRPDPAIWRQPAALLAGNGDGPGSAAVALFVQRALAARPELAIGAESEEGQRNLATIAEICHRLDGLPLAIELAAAQAQALTPATILVLLQNAGLPLLAAGGRDQPPRLQTMEAAIDWSYHLLSGEEQALFRALAVFAGGCSLPAAEWVGRGKTGDGSSSVLAVVASLARQSLLVEEVAVPAHAAPRFRMLEPIRLFALARLRAAGEESAVRGAHATFFAALVEELDARTLGPDPEIWLEQQALDLDNFRAAIDWALAAGENGLAVRLTVYFAQFWIIKGLLAEGRQRLAAAMAVDAESATAIRWYLRFWAGNFALDAGDAAGGAAHAQQMMEIAEAGGDRVGAGAGLTLLSRAVGSSADGHEEAAALAQRAVEILEPLEQGEWTGWAWSRLGIEYQQLGRLDEARDCLLRSLEIRREMGCEACVSYSLVLLGTVLLELGQPASARDAYRECLELTIKHDNPTLMLPALIGLADVAWRSGEGERPERTALRFMGAAEALRERHGLLQGEEARQTIARWLGSLRGSLGDVAVAEGIEAGMGLPLPAVAELARHLEVGSEPFVSAARGGGPSLAAALGNID